MSIELSASTDELKSAFFCLETRQDIANLLEISEKQLIYYLYIIPEDRRYKYFEIPKKSGGFREILAPATALKIIQQKLNQVFQSVYKIRPSAHGFVSGKSIVSNSLLHVRKRYVLNIDLKDFFPTIHFGRVRGLFLAPPYNRNNEVATILAQICCYKGFLPQGAPTSPTVSNMICSKLDSQLQRLAKDHRCTYSRYADDITISTSRPKFPKGLGFISEETGELVIGDELKTIVLQNGFSLNEQKNRLQHYTKRQEVTGLTVNIFPNVQRKYVREIRGMLHAWEKYGYEAAESTYRMKYAGKHSESKRETISFKRVVEGKLNYLKMVKGDNNLVYLNLLAWFWRLSPDSAKHELLTPKTLPKPLIFTEGKTDYKHLQAAHANLINLGLYNNLDVQFEEYGDQTQMGHGELKKMCQTYSKRGNSQPTILIFDRDVRNILNEVTDEEKGYKKWGNNVYSFAIPIPAHRGNNSDICIELYFQDKDIKRKDRNGRRLFLSDEFDEKNGRHKTLDRVYTRSNKINNSKGTTIIDSQVFTFDGASIALSKDDFADLIKNNDPYFQNIDFSEFKKIFDIIITILSEN